MILLSASMTIITNFFLFKFVQRKNGPSHGHATRTKNLMEMETFSRRLFVSSIDSPKLPFHLSRAATDGIFTKMTWSLAPKSAPIQLDNLLLTLTV
jgi:hypothetical protein